MANPETNFWQQVKKNLPKYRWVRIESWATQGVPDLLGFTEEGKLFTVELKVIRSKKLSFSPHQIAFHVLHPTDSFILVTTYDQSFPKLYPGCAVQELVACGLELEACRLPLEAWDQLESLLLAA